MRFFKYLQKGKQLNSETKLSKLLDMYKENAGDALGNNQENLNRRKKIDKTCSYKIKNSHPEEIQVILDALIAVMPAAVVSLNCYTEAIKKLQSNFIKNPSEEKFVKLSFYLGLFKRKHPGPILLKNLIDLYSNSFIEKISSIDFAIICTATFKASVQNKNVKFLNRLINEVIDTSEIDSEVFIAFIKSLRQNKINSPVVLKKLKSLSNENKLQNLDYKSLVHIFPIIADNLIKDDKLSKVIVDTCLKTFDDQTRSKDIQKLLYSCSMINYNMKQSDLKNLESNVILRTQLKEFHQRFDNFVDIALSMWMLNYKSHGLIQHLFFEKRFHEFSANPDRVKIDSRKKLLKTCVEIERPNWIKDSNKPTKPSFDENRVSPTYLIRPSIQKVLEDFQKCETSIVHQIKNLNIAGILVKEADGSNLHVEVLDSTNAMSDNTPNGLLSLKLRLLKHLNCKVHVVCD
ncbi:CLUMA_CG015893, isoform A [Clunio marinus]|uniref:CLUMA_CG015893, isoform A n=1 Tax=Clunio marinus TaxID=568069 RepID=A0A1J1ITX7_9DIPT|nr:CLUMA_CG015893, isoform A [Clunio marinus]